MIELFSLPGAGKSTLAHEIAREFNLSSRADLSACWAQQSSARRFGYILRSFLDVRTCLAALHLIAALRLRAPESLFRLGRLLAKRLWVRSRGHDLILDQGFLQDLWSILYSAGRLEPDPRPISRLINRLYRGMAACILWIDVDQDTAAGRIAGRAHGDSRLDGLDHDEIIQRLAVSHGLIVAIKAAAIDAGLAVCTVDGHLPLALQLAASKNFIEQGATD